MMNSTNDDFADNPFRSGAGGNNEDRFFNVSAAPAPIQQQQQQQQPMNFQQPSAMQQPPQQVDPFAPQPAPADGGPNGFPPLTGAMQTMQQPMPQQQQHQQQQGQTQTQPPAPRSWWGNLMMCMTLDSYRVYFNIDADDIITRIKAVMIDFYKPEHFRNNVLGTQQTDSLKGPDLYGPFWITMTLIFFIGVTSNMHDYLHSSKDDIEEFDYDINHLLHAASILCSYAFALPIVLWLTTQCMNIQALLLVDWVCLYGYSLVPFMPAVVLCIIPFAIVSWVCLVLATMMSCSLVVRNVIGPLLSSDVGQVKAPPIVLAILGSHTIFVVFLKFSFYHHTNSSK